MTTTKKMEKQPAVVMDKTPVDPTLCQCEGVQRRWDGDGLVETVDGVNWYQCSACGKKYR
jgi:hypothetical protein